MQQQEKSSIRMDLCQYIVALHKDRGMGMNAPKIVIRKYGNRRLYDTSTSRYVNLEELAAMVRNGNEVEVVDAATGEDLTRVTLTQIIAEETKDHPAGLPLELLRQLILASDKVRQDYLMWYLKSAFEGYQKIQSSLQSGLAQVGSAALSPLETIRNLLHVPSPNDVAEQEIKVLRTRVAELEAQLNKQKKSKRSLPRAQEKTKSRKPISRPRPQP
jgi:polyhydroxyalkanoate synthesis repressor PhaR